MPFVLFGLVVAIGIMLLFGGTDMDRGLLMLIANVDAPGLKSAAAVAEWIARPWPLLVATAAGTLWLLVRRAWTRALLLGGIILSGWAVIGFLQRLTLPLRPSLEERVLASQAAGGFPDTPVAHATLVLIALPLLLALTRPARPIFGGVGAMLALAIGWSRILLGEAWPSDVIAGWGVALVWVVLPLRIADYDIGDGTPRPLRHSSGKEKIMDNPRTETARANDDRNLIEGQEPAAGVITTSGGTLQRDIGSRDEMKHGETGAPGIERVRDADKSEGENLPRTNER